MKRFFLAFFIFLILFTFIFSFASANLPQSNLDGDAQRCAEALRELDLFRGTDKGFELERPMTRAEAAAMLVRFLGAERTALSDRFSHPFTDVPKWADSYVGWLYQSGLTKGISKTLYGSSNPVTAWQYATFITRALRDNEFIPPELITDADINRIDGAKKFIRADAAIMSARALSCYYTKNENFRSFAEVCIERGLFSADELGTAAAEIFPSTYTVDNENHIVRRVFGIEVTRTSDGGYFVFDAIDTIASDGSAYDPFVYRQAGDVVTILSMDRNTLEMTELATRRGISGHYNYKNLFKLGDTHFIFETLSEKNKNTLLAVKDGKVNEFFSFIEDGTSWYPYADQNVFVAAESALVVSDKEYFIITDEKCSRIPSENLEVLAYFDNEIIAKRINKASVDILLLDAATGKEKVSYNIPDDMTRDEYGEGFRDLGRESEGYYYGEAGLYFYDGKTLIQITSRPANAFIKCDDGGYIINTHKSGKRYSGMVHFGGNELVYISPDGNEKYLTPEDMPFSIDGIFLKNGQVHFTVATGVGMMNFDVYTYRIEDNGKFTVTDFNAGRPEVMDGFSFENPTAYKIKYIKAEQERISKLGY